MKNELRKQMKMTTSQLRRIIREVAKGEAEAPEGAPLDRVAFADERLDVPFPEKDNKVEKELLRGLQLHINSESTPLDVEKAKLLRSILDSGYYKKLIHRPSTDLVYRGMHSLSDEWMTVALGPGFKVSGSSSSSFVFTPQAGRATSSWTADKSTANDFSKFSNDSDGGYWITMTARAADNPALLDMTHLYSVLDDSWTLEGEQEVVALAPVKVVHVAWGLI